MKIRIDDSEKKKLAVSAVCSALSGILNGLFGAGGGILLMLMFAKLSKRLGDAFASVVMTVALMSAVSAWRYYKMGAVDEALLDGLVLPAVVGGYLGAWLSGKIKAEWLRVMFGVMLVISGINMAV